MDNLREEPVAAHIRFFDHLRSVPRFIEQVHHLFYESRPTQGCQHRASQRVLR